MNVDDFLELLDYMRPAGENQWVARCPAHDDRHASLSLGVGTDGRILTHCHRGCTVFDIAESLQLDVRDLFGDTDRQEQPVFCGGRIRLPARRVYGHTIESRRLDSPDPLPSDEDLARWRRNVIDVAGWLSRARGWSLQTLLDLEIGWDGRRVVIPVADETGAVVSIVRYRPGGVPKTIALAGRPRDLFPRVEDIAVADVWLVEGEADAISARELGIPAVGVPGVATRDRGWLARLEGRSVTICFDCDAPGREAAAAWLDDLEEAAIPARVADLDEDRDDGMDLTDLLVVASRTHRLDEMRASLRRLGQEAWA